MKRIFALLMTLVVIATLTTVTFAENGGFYESPSKNQAPTLDDFKNEDEECEATLKITSYADREQLSAEAQQKMAEAFAAIASSTDLTQLDSKLKTMAEELGVATADLAVSDLFDIALHEDEDHDAHGSFTVTLGADTLKNFVALLHYSNGQWNVVPGASVDGDKLTFTIGDFSPFAIVVNTNPGAIAPVEPDGMSVGAIIALVAAIVAVSGGIAFLVVFLLKKKKKATPAA